jgi:hypothetical protein
MLIKDQKLVLLKCSEHDGTRRTGEKFKFVTAKLLDDDANVLPLRFSRAIQGDRVLFNELLLKIGHEIHCDFVITPNDRFSLNGTITKVY